MTEQPERVLGDGARGEDEPQADADTKLNAAKAQEPAPDTTKDGDDHDGDA